MSEQKQNEFHLELLDAMEIGLDLSHYEYLTESFLDEED